jgi:hypothetical protein
LRLRRLRKRIERDLRGRTYTDAALEVTEGDKVDHFVEVFAAKLPPTYGAPVKRIADHQQSRAHTS